MKMYLHQCMFSCSHFYGLSATKTLVLCCYGSSDCISLTPIHKDENGFKYVDCPQKGYVVKLIKDKDSQPPLYATPGSSGFDLSASEDITIKPGERKLVSTGLKMEIPEGYEIQIRPRSGLSLKTSLIIANSPGTIDSDYRGEIKIILWNAGDQPVEIKKGNKIAQGALVKVERAKFELVDSLSETKRGEGGFGHTGI